MAKWTASQKRIARKMRLHGCSLKEIAERVGKSEEAVKTYMSRNRVRKTDTRYQPEVSQLCWDCAKANGSGDCEWANRVCRKTVAGWTAEAIPARGVYIGMDEKEPWYIVTACPKFVKG